jgi:Chaperone of endosialidase
VGWSALASNTSGINNTGIGFNALANNATGSDNVALGDFAGELLTTGNGNIEIGNPGEAGEANTTRIGAFQTRTFIAGIHNVTTAGAAIPVVIDGSGQLGTFSSSRRGKKEIRPMDNISESILWLKPVTFRYRSGANGIAQFGLIAEEVAEVNPDLVVRDENGEVLTVRYDAVNAMLLNEFLKARRQIDAQQKQIEALTEGLQKVSAQLEASKRAPQVVSNP